MWRVLIYLAIIAALAFGAVWLAEQPGSIAFIWNGVSYSVGLAIAALVLLALIAAILLIESAARIILNLPQRLSVASRERKKRKGIQALSRGMIAVGSGDENAARRYAREVERYLRKDEPLLLLLKAQSAQISGDRDTAEQIFREMADTEETRVLGLRGLYVEARRRGDADAAFAHASEAARLAPAVDWANEAVLEGLCARGDWRGAIDTVERRAALGLIDKPTAKRHRAVLLTADALARGESDEEGALASVKEAVRLAPDLVPAAALAGQILGRRLELRKAAKIVQTAWQSVPHPELASVYTHLRAGDSTHDRMERAERLAMLSSWSPEGRIALARAALEAREYAKARETLRPLLQERPSVRVCLLMADIERSEHGASGRAREWLARAVHAPRDKAWIADGVVSDRWSPISPVSGRLDAFRWAAPPELLSGAGTAVIDDVLGDLDDHPGEPVAIAPPQYAAAEEAEIIEPAKLSGPQAPDESAEAERFAAAREAEARAAEQAKADAERAEAHLAQARVAEAEAAERKKAEAKAAEERAAQAAAQEAAREQAAKEQAQREQAEREKAEAKAAEERAAQDRASREAAQRESAPPSAGSTRLPAAAATIPEKPAAAPRGDRAEAAGPETEDEAVVVPLTRLPDDPGPEPQDEPERKRSRFSLFGSG